MPVGWREETAINAVPQFDSSDQGHGGFDTGTSRGGSIELMRATWKGRPIADKRTAAAPVSNPPLRLPGACRPPHSRNSEPPNEYAVLLSTPG